jgi:3-isopropylmalate dehydratase small subunit
MYKRLTMEPIKGKAWKFGNNVDTDLMVPGQYLDAPMETTVTHVFESVRPNFAANVNKGDIIVAGKNFGCGSSREQAPAALKALQIGCILAESFARIFFRNAIAIGLPILTCARISGEFDDGEQASIYLSEARIENNTRGTSYFADPLSQEMLSILDKGGILELLKDINRGD